MVQSFHEPAETDGRQRRSCSEHDIPDFGRAAVFDVKRAEFELTFPDPVHEFDPGDGDRGVSEPLQTEHGAQAKLDRPMILFNEVVQIFRRSNLGSRAATMLCEGFPRRTMRSLISVERDFTGQVPVARERPTEERFGGGHISLRAQEEIDGLPGLVDSAVEIGPATLDLDVSLVDAPRSADWASKTAPPPFEFSNIALAPAHDRL